jgi:hypothetical protein
LIFSTDCHNGSADPVSAFNGPSWDGQPEATPHAHCSADPVSALNDTSWDGQPEAW